MENPLPLSNWSLSVPWVLTKFTVSVHTASLFPSSCNLQHHWYTWSFWTHLFSTLWLLSALADFVPLLMVGKALKTLWGIAELLGPRQGNSAPSAGIGKWLVMGRILEAVMESVRGGRKRHRSGRESDIWLENSGNVKEKKPGGWKYISPWLAHLHELVIAEDEFGQKELANMWRRGRHWYKKKKKKKNANAVGKE